MPEKAPPPYDPAEGNEPKDPPEPLIMDPDKQEPGRIGTDENDNESEGNEDEVAEYVSSSDISKRVHQFGGRTRDIVSQEDIIRINELQQGVGRFRSSLDTA